MTTEVKEEVCTIDDETKKLYVTEVLKDINVMLKSGYTIDEVFNSLGIPPDDFKDAVKQ